MNKQEITEKVNTLMEMLFTEGKIKGMERSSQIFTGEPASEYTESVETKTAVESSSSVVMGSDAHPVLPPIKPVDVKSITVELEDNQLVLKLGGIVRNKHTSPVAETKFTQLLMMIKDQFANWNSSNNGKDN